MRKSLRMIPAFLIVAAMIAPRVRADSVTLTCNGDNNSPGNVCFEAAPTAPNVTFSSSGTTLDITWYSQTFDLTLNSLWKDSDSFSWLASNKGFFIFDNTQPFTVSASASPINTNLPDGTGISEFGTLSFTPGTGGTGPSATPEPGTLLLLGSGLTGIGFLRRKLWASRFAQHRGIARLHFPGDQLSEA